MKIARISIAALILTVSIVLQAAVCGYAAFSSDRADNKGEIFMEGNYVMRTLTSGGTNDYYIGSREPLAAAPLAKLPVGAVRPEGWLRYQLEALADGLTGRLEEISPWLSYDRSAWADSKGTGEYGWEEMPYWFRGFVALGYVLDDKRIIAEARKWIEPILASQRPNGYFGPQSNLDNRDLWPNMIILYAMRTYYEASGDKRVIDFMTKYFKWQTTLPLDQFLPGWEKVRGGDNLDHICWLYDQTGEDWLLRLAYVNHERTDDWAAQIPSWHGVNFSQGFREAAQYYRLIKDKRYLDAAQRNFDTAMSLYGQVPGGMFGADENARPGFNGPRQGTETCSMVEAMYSFESMLGITGDVKWADRAEDVAFNSLPAAMTPDLKGLHYLTSPNSVQLDRQSKAPLLQNGGDMLSYNPFEYRCCQHNVGFGWPYFTQYAWMAAGDNGLAAVFYGPTAVRARVGDGTEVQMRQVTDYPFDGKIALELTSPKAVSFPLYLRIPEWCGNPSIKANGQAVEFDMRLRGWAVISRTWKSGDIITLDLPMGVRVKRWTQNRNSVSVYRGPLAYSLKIDEIWERCGGTDSFPQYEVFAGSPWNYALEIDWKNPESSFEVVRIGATGRQPFSPEGVPVAIKAKGRRIPEWGQEANGLVGELQKSPVRTGQPPEDIALVPMGAARLRISAFPYVGEGPDAVKWDPAAITVAGASFVSKWDTPQALNDGKEPKSSSDTAIPRLTWWDHLGTTEWAEYYFAGERKVSEASVYWYDDNPGGCRAPSSWKLLWWDGEGWNPVVPAKGSSYGTAVDQYNTVKFTPVRTTALRLQVSLQPGYSGGILEWKVK